MLNDYKTIKTSSGDYIFHRPFTISDIYQKDPCKDEFVLLLQEVEDPNYAVKSTFYHKNDLLNSPVLKRNLKWLADNGFIKKLKNIFLVPGNTFTITYNNGTKYSYFITKDYTVFSMQNGDKINLFSDLKTFNELVAVCKGYHSLSLYTSKGNLIITDIRENKNG